MSEKHTFIAPDYNSAKVWCDYSATLAVEYRQSIEEGKDISSLKGLFDSISALPPSEKRAALADELFEMVYTAPTLKDFKYDEPSSLEEIKKTWEGGNPLKTDKTTMSDRLYGAWMGRVCGCMAGRTFEGSHTNELIPFLKEADNFPLRRLTLSTDVKPGVENRYGYPFKTVSYPDLCDGMPTDDDTNYTIIGCLIAERYGRDFTARDVGDFWIACQSINAYCTAERVAYINLINSFRPPESANYKNPYREWIGAQIRADFWGYINPGNPALAADMAWRDASVSHIKNGIYGEMLFAAAIAAAASSEITSPEAALNEGLKYIPKNSRLHEKVTAVIKGYNDGVTAEECFSDLHKRYNEYDSHDWCHTISNAEIVAASLLYGEGDYAKTVGTAVEQGFDTDCNGATAGSLFGMLYGIDSIPEKGWKDIIHDNLHTSIHGCGGMVSIKSMADRTLKLVNYAD